MNRLLSATAALLLAVSSVGCCCTGYSVTACDPCGRELAGGGCCLRKLFHPHEWSCLKCKCHHGHGCAPMGDCCDTCGGYGGTFGDPALSFATGGGCGCDGGGMAPAYPPPAAAYPPPAPTPVPAPAPQPQPVPGVPGAMHHVPIPTTQARPVALMAQRTAMPAAAPIATAQAAPGPQSVSYEEFQRLPGVMVSAPGATAQAAPPVLPNVAPNPPVQPTSWAPAK